MAARSGCIPAERQSHSTNSCQSGRPIGVYPAERQSPSSVARCGRHRGGARARGSHGAPSGGFSVRDLAVTQVFSSEPACLLVIVCVVIGLGVGVEQGEFSELPSGTCGGEDVVSADEGRGVG